MAQVGPCSVSFGDARGLYRRLRCVPPMSYALGLGSERHARAYYVGLIRRGVP
jgi:hypothetical protein